MTSIFRVVRTLVLGLALVATPAAAVNIDGTWSICFPHEGFPLPCGKVVATMTASGNAFEITLPPFPYCTIHGTVDATTGAINVPAGECATFSMLSFTGTATDTTFNANAQFLMCSGYTNITAVRACGACDDGNTCTTDGCGATACSAPSSSCTIGNVPPATSCSDGSGCTTGDVCQGDQCTGVPVVCDDNNPCTDDMCDSAMGACVFTPNTASCDDQDACTTSDTCSAGACVGGPALECAPCTTCDPSGGCMAGPKTCQASLGKAKLQLKDGVDDVRDKVKWSWGKGVTGPTNPFGDPTTSDDYTLCIFDGAGRPWQRLFLDASAPAGGTCADGSSCWLGRGTPPGAKGYVYRDSKILLPDGLKKIQLKPGIDGRAKATAAGAGPNLALPSPMHVNLPVVVQLQGESGACFQSVFSAATVSTEDTFKAVSSPSPAFVDAP
jgi:hypothetical protein